MRKALVVGINYYDKISGLFGCVNDAYAVKNGLERHSDGSINFSVRLKVATAQNDRITRTELKNAVRELFADDSEIALFYFAGHGYLEDLGGYLCASDCDNGDDGLSLADVVNIANQSKARNKIIVLDSCHSGVAGNSTSSKKFAEMTEGLTILTASTDQQYANEENGAGVFTTLFVDALNGAAGNLVGDVTPGSVYAHIDQSLGPWDQRPVFKTNVKSFVSLRTVQAPISLQELQRITDFFPGPGIEFRLDPAFEPESESPDPDKTSIFSILQKYNRTNLVVPVDAPHMYHAAMYSKACKLTVLGEHYRRLVARKLI
ncbi:caspase family protein [Undibacterium rugosum]|uniref:Caspase family protein n=1 Tax=Undibacterium rugosum TaxID=2762291 RepID=A0A923I6H2_9BURK|nr:caspase family protein [Undibacterium rugosum]MBC3937044.1 caspase family protein [Undibacterium rugosum]MBR7780270.1 caspase family protein [Undibacterium rugosum]